MLVLFQQAFMWHHLGAWQAGSHGTRSKCTAFSPTGSKPSCPSHPYLASLLAHLSSFPTPVPTAIYDKKESPLQKCAAANPGHSAVSLRTQAREFLDVAPERVDCRPEEGPTQASHSADLLHMAMGFWVEPPNICPFWDP